MRPPAGPLRSRRRGRSGEQAPDPPLLTASDTFPELVAEWMPDARPGDTEGEWVSLVPYLASGTCKRGRRFELDRSVAGTMTLTLRAATRVFDPDNAAGPYYGRLIPMRPVRVRAKWAGAWWPVWRGFVTSWGTTVAQDTVWVTEVACRGVLERLERIRVGSSPWAMEVVRDRPSLWFRLGETGTARVSDSSTGGHYGVYDNVVQGATGLVPNDSDGAVEVEHTTDNRVTVQSPGLITGYPFTVTAMIRCDSQDSTLLKVIFGGLVNPATQNPGMGLFVDYTFPGRLGAVINAGTTTKVVSSIVVADDRPHHVAWVARSARDMSLYVDGVDVTVPVVASASATWIGPVPSGYTIGNYTDGAGGDYGFVGTIDEVCVWDGRALEPARIAAHAHAARSGWEGDTSGVRVSRFLDLLGWPAEQRVVEPGVAVLGAARFTAGASALSVLHAWADSELGLLHETADGKIGWRGRYLGLLDVRATRSQATFSDEAGTRSPYLRAAFSLRRDETAIRNPVSASRAEGISVTVRDDDLADNLYGDRVFVAPQTEERDDAVVRDRAAWILAQHKLPRTRLASMSVNPTRDPEALWPVVLGLDLGDRITVRHHPGGLDAPITVDQTVESIQHAFSPTTWSTTIEASPPDPMVGSYLLFDDEAAGLCDTGLLAY